MRQLIIWFFLSIFSVLAQASIQLQVEPSQVTLGETFKLSLIQEGVQNGGVPDLTPLQKDFVILGTERNVSYTIINGQAQSSSQWSIALKAKKAGSVTIPVLKVGLEESAPFTINVEANAKGNEQKVGNTSSQQDDVMLTASVDEKKPYVSQQIIYTVKLYYSKRLLDSSYQGPEVNDALVIPFGTEKRYQTLQNNINYIVEEQSYAIFPQKQGTLKIKSPTFTALVYDFDPQRIQVQDKTINLEVQPAPGQYKGTTWLPAKQIKLREHYDTSNQIVSQGSTLTRTITIEGLAIPAQLLPTLHFESTDAFHVYPEKGGERTQVKQGQLVGSTEIKVTYLFNKAGKTTIPEVRLPWFNTETGQEEEAILAPRSMDIQPSASVSVNGTTTSQPVRKEAAAEPSVSSATSTVQAKSNEAWVIALLFAIAWIGTLMLWGWQKYSRKRGKGGYKKALNALDTACKEGNPEHARDALLKWASLHWPDAPLLHLTDVSKLAPDAQLKKQVQLLSQVLYGREEDKSMWRGDELLRAVQSVKRGNHSTQSKSKVLPPINPL